MQDKNNSDLAAYECDCINGHMEQVATGRYVKREEAEARIAELEARSAVDLSGLTRYDVSDYGAYMADKADGDYVLLSDVQAALSTANAAQAGVREESADTSRINFLRKNPGWSLRWRVKNQREQWQMLDDGEPWGQWGEFRQVIDAARRGLKSAPSPSVNDDPALFEPFIKPSVNSKEGGK